MGPPWAGGASRDGPATSSGSWERHPTGGRVSELRAHHPPGSRTPPGRPPPGLTRPWPLRAPDSAVLAGGKVPRRGQGTTGTGSFDSLLRKEPALSAWKKPHRASEGAGKSQRPGGSTRPWGAWEGGPGGPLCRLTAVPVAPRGRRHTACREHTGEAGASRSLRRREEPERQGGWGPPRAPSEWPPWGSTPAVCRRSLPRPPEGTGLRASGAGRKEDRGAWGPGRTKGSPHAGPLCARAQRRHLADHCASAPHPERALSLSHTGSERSFSRAGGVGSRVLR